MTYNPGDVVADKPPYGPYPEVHGFVCQGLNADLMLCSLNLENRATGEWLICRKPSWDAMHLRPIDAPEIGTPWKCMICALVKPWGIWDSNTGTAVCVECRDKARSGTPPEELEALQALREVVWELMPFVERLIPNGAEGFTVKQRVILALEAAKEAQK